jgi:primosomal protein N' (replication factor Y) (superfamily II helicase)
VNAPRAVRVITDVAAVDRPFDYLVTEQTQQVAVGDRVRIDFNHRVVRGWVSEEVPVSEGLKPLSKWLGYGPTPGLLTLATWASKRWYSPVSRFLVTATPKKQITSLPAAPAAVPLHASVVDELRTYEPGVHQLSPTTDPLDLILSAYQQTYDREGSLLVLVPTEAWAGRLRGRLEQRGCSVAMGDQQWDRIRAGWPVVVGARGTALAPVPNVCGAVVVDADDESYRSESSPTWDAATMLVERCRLDDAPIWLTSSVPSPTTLSYGPLHIEPDSAHGWPRVEIIDRRSSDPRDGVLSRGALDEAHRALSGDESIAVVVVLQRLGTGRLFACKKCGELARCEVCGLGEEEVEDKLSCRERHELRESFCRSCGATNLKRVRSGVTTLARDVAAQLSQPVSEVTSLTDLNGPLHRVVVGTEAVWQRVRRCGVVIFVDFDQYLLAPRASARRQALGAVAKAGRLVGSKKSGRGAVVIQTRRGEDEVVVALTSGHIEKLVQEDVETAQVLSLAPFGAVAHVSGEGAEEFVDGLRLLTVRVFPEPGGFSVHADSIETLTDCLRSVTRPNKKFRVAVE